jgi:hypothetical protein
MARWGSRRKESKTARATKEKTAKMKAQIVVIRTRLIVPELTEGSHLTEFILRERDRMMLLLVRRVALARRAKEERAFGIMMVGNGDGFQETNIITLTGTIIPMIPPTPLGRIFRTATCQL